MNTLNISGEINFLFSEEVDQEDQDQYIDDHTTEDGHII